MLSDLLGRWFGADALRHTLCLMVLTYVPATIHFLLANRTVKADIAAAEAD
jgi:hypothetical protein